VCRLTWLVPDQRLDAASERGRYEQHRNDPADAGYRAFLNRLAAPLLERLTPGAEGLDYGAGPGPTLSRMLAEAGLRVRDYDPFFAPDADALRGGYDFITCTETVEHFFEPGRELDRLDALLRPGGWLAVMTEVRDDRPFEQWWYVRDPTHVCFYRAETFEWIAQARGWRLERPHRNVALFRKGG
jgi:2-polyprenyl-3-methyl-5-hydroxy-6-metoxy-1,4-benzoquinol methylase